MIEKPYTRFTKRRVTFVTLLEETPFKNQLLLTFLHLYKTFPNDLTDYHCVESNSAYVFRGPNFFFIATQMVSWLRRTSLIIIMNSEVNSKNVFRPISKMDKD